MKRAIFLVFILFLLESLSSSIIQREGFVCSSVKITGETKATANSILDARNTIASELSDYFRPAIRNGVMEYLKTIPENRKEIYREVIQDFQWGIPTNTIIYSENNQQGSIAITGKLPLDFDKVVVNQFINTLDEKANALELRRNDIRKRIAEVIIEEAPDDINAKLAMAAYYAYEYENGRIEEDRNARSVDEMIASLNLKDPYLEAYMLAAGKQVEKASEEVKNTVLTAAMLKYLYLLMD